MPKINRYREDAPQERASHYGWVIVAVGALLMAVCHAGVFSCASLFVKPVCEGLGFSRSAFSAYQTIASLSSIVFSPVMGRIVAGSKTKRVLLLSLLLLVLDFAGFALASHLWQFYVLGILQKLAYAGVGMLPVSILVNNWFGPQKKGLAISLAYAGSGVGGIVLSPLVTKVILHYGWRGGYLFLGLLALCVLPVAAVWVVRTPEERGLHRVGDCPEASKAPPLGMTAREATHSALFWFLMISLFLNNMACCSVLSQGPAYYSDIGFTAMQAAQIVSVAAAFLTLGKIVLGVMHDKLGDGKAVAVGTAMILAEFFCLYQLAYNRMFLAPYMLSYGLAMAVGTVSVPLITAAFFGDRDYGAIVGMVNATVNLGNAVGPLVAARIYDTTGSYGAAWLLMIGVGAAALLTLLPCFGLRKKQNY